MPESSRSALLRASLPLFAARGFEGVSTREIAGAAALPQGLIRHHFGSKEELWREVAVQGVTALCGWRAESVPDPAHACWVAHLEQHAAVLALLAHALLEPGPRRQWLVEAQLRPALVRVGPRLALALGRAWPLPEPDLIALVGAALAPALIAQLAGRAPADERAPRAALPTLPVPESRDTRRAWAPLGARRLRSR